MLQAQLQLINDLVALTVEEKVQFIFEECDVDGDGKVSAADVFALKQKKKTAPRGLLGKQVDPTALPERLSKSMDTFCAVGSDAETGLDAKAFSSEFLHIAQEVGASFAEVTEFFTIQLLLGVTSNSISLCGAEQVLQEQIDVAAATIDTEAKKREALSSLLLDKRLKDLFVLCDARNTGRVTTKDVAISLLQITEEMEESAKKTTELLFLNAYSEDGQNLSYEQFGLFVLAVVGATGYTFDRLSTLLMTKLVAIDVTFLMELKKMLVSNQMLSDAPEFQEAPVEDNIVDALLSERLNKVFALWDPSHDGLLSYEALAEELNSYQPVANGGNDAGTSPESEASFMSSDTMNVSTKLSKGKASKSLFDIIL
jgi:Ca2+-binding EF-hand superfamily protein